MDQHRWTRSLAMSGCYPRPDSPTRVHDEAEFRSRLEGLMVKIEGSCVRVIARRDFVELLRGRNGGSACAYRPALGC